MVLPLFMSDLSIEIFVIGFEMFSVVIQMFGRLPHGTNFESSVKCLKNLSEIEKSSAHSSPEINH